MWVQIPPVVLCGSAGIGLQHALRRHGAFAHGRSTRPCRIMADYKKPGGLTLLVYGLHKIHKRVVGTNSGIQHFHGRGVEEIRKTS